ncbi:hypothetical protein QFC21_001424 [Naganishia friedmannii]|uniref:Uncharacterized protein n=1 Tax=Naganishia friedmannii TaxID=89922 RepID=A0ACC2W4S1_9TREE|nr:hypothetical protein QFC21_001424 [Naganishia friedmannii]
MSPPMSPKEAQTPRPVETEFIPSNEQTPHEESTSTPQSGDSHAVSQDGRKSVSSSSARSSGSLSTSYSSPDDDRSEVGELPDNQSITKEQPVQVGKQSPGNGDVISLDRVAMEGDGQVEKLEKQLADMDIQEEAGREADDDDADSYLNDPLVKYTIQLHDYTPEFCTRNFNAIEREGAGAERVEGLTDPVDPFQLKRWAGRPRLLHDTSRIPSRVSLDLLHR